MVPQGLEWRLSNTLEPEFCVAALEEALARHGKPEIFNTDQGSQFTSLAFTQVLKDAGVRISMDGDHLSWPGVHEGISKLYHTDNPSFVPFCYTCNKLFLTDMGHQRKYMDAIFDLVRSTYPKSRIKKVQRYGWETLTIIPDLNEPVLSR